MRQSLNQEGYCTMCDSADDIRTLTKRRGEEEEALLRMTLEEIGRSSKTPYFAAKNAVFIPARTGFAETDALFISRAGIFVFECKHMTGTVIGKISDRLWTKTGETVLSFPNPVLQSRRHADAAAEYFGVSRALCYSFAVFNDSCRLEQEAESAVLRTGELKDALRPLLSVQNLSGDEVTSLIAKAEKLSSDDKIRKQHEAQIQQRKKERRAEKKRR